MTSTITTTATFPVEVEIGRADSFSFAHDGDRAVTVVQLRTDEDGATPWVEVWRLDAGDGHDALLLDAASAREVAALLLQAAGAVEGKGVPFPSAANLDVVVQSVRAVNDALGAHGLDARVYLAPEGDHWTVEATVKGAER